MTDNIFEIEKTALAHVACAPRVSGILLTDFAAAYPSVNHSCIFHVLENTELFEFICRFLRRVFYDSTTRVEFAGTTRGQFLTGRGVRQGRPTNGFLFAMAFDHIFRWLQDAIIPRNLDDLDFLRRPRCGCSISSGLDDRFGTCPAHSGPNSWTQFEPSEMLLGAVW